MGWKSRAWERLEVQEQKAGNREGGQGKRTTAPTGEPSAPTQGKLPGWTRRVWAAGRASCPRGGGSWQRGARDALYPARPPARAPQSAPGAARAMLAAPAAAASAEKAAASVGVRTR